MNITTKITLWAACVMLSVSTYTYAQHPSKPITIGETVELHSKVLAENRTLNVYLPEGYDPKDTMRYPVIYLLDGGLDEDFIHVAGLVQFSSFSWVNYIAPSIIVGIANIDRKRDFTYPTTVKKDKEQFPTTGGSAKFISFLQQELQPYIKKQYKTSGTSMLIGESLGGLLAAEILQTKPDLFNDYIIVSPSLWWDDGSLLKKQAVTPAKPINVYLAVGKEGLAPTATPHVMEVDANILADKLKDSKNINLYFDYLPEENHATIMHQALLNAFRTWHTR